MAMPSFWSIGPTISETIFNAGLYRAELRQYTAVYNADLAAYRQTVLVAFEQVEDYLAAVRLYSQQIEKQKAAVDHAQQFLSLEMNRYQTGLDPYIDVVTAQTTLLADQQTLVTIQVSQMTSSVSLIEALGGGWDRSQLPTSRQLTAKPPRRTRPGRTELRTIRRVAVENRPLRSCAQRPIAVSRQHFAGSRCFQGHTDRMQAGMGILGYEAQEVTAVQVISKVQHAVFKAIE